MSAGDAASAPMRVEETGRLHDVVSEAARETVDHVRKALPADRRRIEKLELTAGGATQMGHGQADEPNGA